MAFPTTVTQGSTVRVDVVFMDSGGNTIDPTGVVTQLLDPSGSLISTFTPTKLNTGQYTYDWVPASVGYFTLRFTGTYQSTTQNIDLEYSVTPAAFGTNTFLGEDQYITFVPQVTNILADPEDIHRYVPAASLVEIVEEAAFFSAEAIRILDGRCTDEPDENLNFTSVEYVKAATICALHKVYDVYGSASTQISLGDLVVRTQDYTSQGDVTRANAANWCQMAEILRQELMHVRAHMRPIMKGSHFRNPIPRRGMQRIR